MLERKPFERQVLNNGFAGLAFDDNQFFAHGHNSVHGFWFLALERDVG